MYRPVNYHEESKLLPSEIKKQNIISTPREPLSYPHPVKKPLLPQVIRYSSTTD